MYLRQPTIVASALAIVLLSTLTQTHAQTSIEESAEACDEAARLIREDKLEDALDEANWCLEGLKQLRQSKTLRVLPDRVNDYVGGEIQSENILGMTTINREYTNGDTKVVVSLMSTGGDLGGLAAIASMGMNMASGKKYRVQKRTVFDATSANGTADFFVQLKSGGMMNISSKALEPESVLEFIKAFPVRDLDEALER